MKIFHIEKEVPPDKNDPRWKPVSEERVSEIVAKLGDGFEKFEEIISSAGEIVKAGFFNYFRKG